MERHRAALALVDHLHRQAEDVAELTLEHDKIGVDRLGVARARPGDIDACAGLDLLCQLLRLADGEAFGDDFLGQRLYGLHQSG